MVRKIYFIYIYWFQSQSYSDKQTSKTKQHGSTFCSRFFYCWINLKWKNEKIKIVIISKWFFIIRLCHCGGGGGGDDDVLVPKCCCFLFVFCCCCCYLIIGDAQSIDSIDFWNFFSVCHIYCFFVIQLVVRQLVCLSVCVCVCVCVCV